SSHRERPPTSQDARLELDEANLVELTAQVTKSALHVSWDELIKLTVQTNERGDARNRCQHSSDSYSSRSTLGRALTCARCAAAWLGAAVRALVGAQGPQRHSNLGAGIGDYGNQVGFLNVLWQSQRYASTAKFILLRIFFSIPLSVDIGGLLHVAHGDGRCGGLRISSHGRGKRGAV